jgi:hypothetical protein
MIPTFRKQEREALVDAAKEGSGISSMVDLWQALGMQRAKDSDAVMSDEVIVWGWESYGNPVEILWKTLENWSLRRMSLEFRVKLLDFDVIQGSRKDE